MVLGEKSSHGFNAYPCGDKTHTWNAINVICIYASTIPQGTGCGYINLQFYATLSYATSNGCKFVYNKVNLWCRRINCVYPRAFFTLR